MKTHLLYRTDPSGPDAIVSSTPDAQGYKLYASFESPALERAFAVVSERYGIRVEQDKTCPASCLSVADAIESAFRTDPLDLEDFTAVVCRNGSTIRTERRVSRHESTKGHHQ